MVTDAIGISSAPEVWQRTMHEFIEGLQGVEVIADDFIIAGFDDTKEEAYKSLEQNERFFFTTCREWNLKLNRDKVKRAQTNVRFTGHQLTPEGLKPDPAKVEAILLCLNQIMSLHSNVSLQWLTICPNLCHT